MDPINLHATGPSSDTQETKQSKNGVGIWPLRFNWVYLYLGAIVAANLLVAKFGSGISILNAFVFIGLDLSSRDSLHKAWEGRGLVWRMGLLIASGSLLSWLLNRGAGPIAIASFLAFAGSAIVDSIFYSILREKSYLVRVNGSNIFGAAVDSFLFLWIVSILTGAPLLVWVMILQFLAKIGGGFVWSLIIRRLDRRDLSPSPASSPSLYEP